MEWPPRTGPLGPDPYPNLYPVGSNLEHQEYQNQLPPTNPPWALRLHAADAGTSYPNEQGGVPLYPPPWTAHDQPRAEHYPPELSSYQEFPPKPSAVESYSDSWTHQDGSSSIGRQSYPNWESQHGNAESGASFGDTTPFQPYPYLQSSDSYPPSSFSDNFPNNFSSPHAFLASTTPSTPNVPGGGPGLSFGHKPPSAHPLLQSAEDDFVPYEEDGEDQGDGGKEQNTGDVEEFNYSHEELEKFGVNLTTSAKEGTLDAVIGRDLVIRQCVEILTRKSKCNPVLVGHPGVGKTAVVEGLAQRIVRGDVPEPLRKCKIISVDVSSIVAGTEFRGQFEQKMTELINEATKAKRKVIIFLDELHRLMGAGKVEGQVEGGSDILKPALARGEFLCIGATTYDEYNKYVEADQALSRRFQKVIVDPPSPEDTISILRGLKPRLESHHGISITDDALIEAVKLSERYIPDRFLPDKAIDLVDVAASKLKIELISKPAKLDEIDRAILELDMERLAVTAATGRSSQDRLQQILSDLEGLKVRQTNLNRKWKKEKALVTRIVSLKEKVAAVKTGSNPPGSVSGLESAWISDGDKSNNSGGDEPEVHVDILCDNCRHCPIIGPRYSFQPSRLNQLDLCQTCYSLGTQYSELIETQLGPLFGATTGFNGVSYNKFRRVEPRYACSECKINPIVGNVYTDMGKFISCEPCYRNVLQLNPGIGPASAIKVRNNLKGSQTEKSNNYATAINSTELEAQLESAEKEWKEYQSSYKPLIQLEVTSITIAEVLSSRTGIPVTKLQASQMQQLLQLDIELHKRVIGQDEACNAIARAIQRSRAGLSDPKRPIASLMFMGPTGVGKTELAKALATHLFHSENAMVRIDMSEYGERSSISRLTGAAPGSVGYGDGGQLTTPVRQQPHAVVLFDEIEKAHDDIFNIFLQILDDGRLTDSEGRVANFTNTIIIMTSNVGAEMIMEVTANSSAYGSKDEAYEKMKSHVMEAARAKYRPEFINRIDEFIVFQPLNPQQICEIVKLQLESVSKRLQDRQINLRVSESALQLLSTMGYDPRYGARPVKRVIQKSIEDPLAQGILRGQYTAGCTIMVDTEPSSLGPSQQPQHKLTFYRLP